MSEQRYRDYDPFARLYSRHWAGDYHAKAMPVLDRLLLHNLAPGSAILDLCCGDGRLARLLRQNGFQVTGLDGSEQMLAFARARATEVTFVACDARDFTFPEPFDAIISTGDSMNHMLSRNELRKVFRNAHACLKPGGWFAFDMNRIEAFRDLWPNMPHIVDIDLVSVAQPTWDDVSQLATCRFTQFRRENGLWLRSDYTIRERYYPEADVQAGLVESGFDSISVQDAAELGMAGEIGQHRNYFLARKP
ncbi:MAG: class I SAM-dependent methyltransferase [Bryobacterales bacterium]|nr:class I SAM-dependent methyltransferase [Bryobacterales bacterium]